jgi:phage terminase large subunit GpA-like protein
MKKSDFAKGGGIGRLGALISRCAAGFRPPEDLTVSEWADRKRKLSSEASAEPGPWRTSRTPYMRGVMDCFNDPKVNRIVLVAASQVGKSEMELNIIGYIIDQDPGSILYIHPTNVDARDFSKLRVAPMVRDCPALNAKVSDPKSRDSGNTILQKTYPGGILTLCGSTEAHALASKPIRYIIGDERDRWATSAGTEGDPWALARARQITFYNRKAIEVSTPTIKNASAIEASFAEGTMERWCVPCPHCGEYNDIKFADIRFDKEERQARGHRSYKAGDVRYVCPHCGAVSDEKTMKGLARTDARWIAENPDAYARGCRSFWLNAFVSPWESWTTIAEAYLNALGSSKKLQVVFNTRFGELWEDRGDLEDEDAYMGKREEYPAELPEGVIVLTCGVDTQDDRLQYEVVGHGHFGETWGIRQGVLMGRPDQPDVWQRLDDVTEHVYRFKEGHGLKISTTFVDEGGHFTGEVRMACAARFEQKVFAIKGSSGGASVPYTAPPRKVKITLQGRYLGTCWQYMIGVDAGKLRIMDNLKVMTPGANYCHFPLAEESGYDKAFFHGMLSERLVYQAGKKNPWLWQKIPGHERNEALDCRNYANAAFKALAPDLDRIGRQVLAARNTKTGEGAGSVPAQDIKQPPQPRKKKKGQALEKYYDNW